MTMSLTLRIDRGDAAHREAGAQPDDSYQGEGQDQSCGYPHIHNVTAILHTDTLSSKGSIAHGGRIDAFLIEVGKMREHRSPTSVPGYQFYAECQAYDAEHEDTALNKVENLLANDSFKAEYEMRVAGAEKILYIEQVQLHPALRGQGHSLEMVKQLICELELGKNTIVMLQAGSMSAEVRADRAEGDDGESATLKLTRHWKKMGFEEWSDSDDAWLLLDPAEL